MLNPSNPRRVFLALAILWLALLGACTEAANQPVPAPPTATTDFVITAVPGISATVTAALELPALPPEQAAPYLEIQALAQACPEFHHNRRLTVVNHMDWLTHPSQVPPQLISLYGDKVHSQLVFGAAYAVATEWKSGGRLPASCLIPIGDRLNVILVALGREPVPEFAVP